MRIVARINNMGIGILLLFLILTAVLVNPSVARESLMILNSSDVPTMLQNNNVMDKAAEVGHNSTNADRSGPITGNDNNIILKSNRSKNRFDISSLKYEHKPGELIVKYAKKSSKKDFENFYKSQNMTMIKDYQKIGYHIIRVDESRLEKSIEALSLSDNFEDAEPNYIVKALKTPNDSRFNELWAMDNSGQTGGTPDADIDAQQAWDISTGAKEVIVAVIDTGVDYTHEDLADNIWTNQGEIPGNGIDDDNNGFVDDYYGWDFAYDDNDPMDVYSHGTHVSGIIGGLGNNGKGVAGVSFNVSIMPVKFLDDSGSGYTSDAIEAINYATMMGADIMSNSWGGGGYSSALKAAIQAAADAGILFVAAAGNTATNTDTSPFYPSGYDVPNVLSVAATDNDDTLASFSNYGTLSVDIGAPGVDILSSVPGNGYSLASGTSMAASHVSGAAALLKGFNPSLTHREIKDILMNSVDPIPSLYGKTVAGGRLNIHKAITSLIVCPIGCYYGGIQAAVDAANPGNMILVRNGTYYENVDVNKQLTLRGIGKPVVDSRGNGSAFTFAADGIILEGFTVTGASYPEAGIKINSNNNTIYNNIFNNTENVQIVNSNINNWNITKQSGTNIIGGLYLGGNLWAKPDGTGFSQKCDDGNMDSICDLAYVLDSTNIDYLPFSTKGSIHNLNKGANYTTIQGAINDASPGDEIHVDSGTYYENVNVNKQLILRGIGMPVVNASGNGSAITLAAQGITLEGFTATMSSYPGAGIKVTSSNNTLSGNNANSNNYGIYLSSSSNNTLSGNNADSNNYGIYLSFSSDNTLSGNNANSNNYNGIYLVSSSNNTLSGNNVSNNQDGIFLFYSSKSLLKYNIMKENIRNFRSDGSIDSEIDTSNLVDGKPIYYIKGARDIEYNSITNAGTFYCIDCVNVTLKNLDLKNNYYGIYFWNTSGSKIQNVNASNNIYGIYLSSSSDNMLNGNSASSNQYYGIFLSSSSNNMLSANKASNNDNGIWFFASSNNTLSGGNNASNNNCGIYLSSSSDNNTLSGNNALNNYNGIYLSSSSDNNTLNGNNASNNQDGISLFYSTKSLLKNNIMKENKRNFRSDGNIDSQIDTSNLVDGKPIYYIKGARDILYDSYTNAGTFYCIDCVNVTLKNLDLKNNYYGIFFWNTTRSIIQNVNTSNNNYSIHFSSSSDNTLSGNNASNNDYGIGLSASSNNTLSGGNNANSNNYGIYLSPSSNNNTLSDNNALNNYFGIWLSSSSNNNTLSGNNASNNNYGIWLSSSSNNNTLSGNNASNNDYGIWLSSSSNNNIYHNNLRDNTIQALDNTNTNSWDTGYPSGGNYWNDYTGDDLKSGKDQDIPGSDGMGDTPYNISVGAQDRYPFMSENGWVEIKSTPFAICGPDKPKCENVGAPVQFNGSASYNPDGAVISYYWDFGDGTNITGAAPKHMYVSYKWNDTAYEHFIVNLTVSDDGGLTNSTSQKVIIWMAGDANGDGKVNILDASVVGLKWNWNDSCADLNNDGNVNILDASFIGLNWGKIA